MSETGETRGNTDHEVLINNLFELTERSVDADVDYGDSGRVRITSVSWAAKDNESVMHVQHEYVRVDRWTKTPCRYRVNYLIGKTSDFCEGEYPLFKPGSESEVSIFYLSNSYTEMEHWANITGDSQSLSKLAELLSAVTD